MLLSVRYNHPQLGNQTVECDQLINQKGALHATNIQGDTIQTLEPSRIIGVNMSKTVHQLKKDIEREIDIVSEDGVIDAYGNWSSKEIEEERLRKLHSEIVYFMNEYG